MPPSFLSRLCVSSRRSVVCLAALVLAFAIPAHALVFPDKPPGEHFYVDQAGMISASDGEAIDAVARKLLTEEQIPLFVVTIPSLASMDAGDLTIERYARELFDHWGIGTQERNYGMLLLVSPGDRKARIELGAGWGTRHDFEAQRVMNTLIIPPFKRGSFGEGIVAGVGGLDAVARGLELPKPPRPWWLLPAIILFFVVGIGVAISLFKSGRKGWGWAVLAGLGVVLFFLLRAAAKSGSSSGGFGGGSSGGGGATGSW
jgi:uncharacterized protein